MTSITLPPFVMHALRHSLPDAKVFTPTRFTPASTKSWFAGHMLYFLSSDLPRHQFTQRFYNQLMHCFSMRVCYEVTAQVFQRGQTTRRSRAIQF